MARSSVQKWREALAKSAASGQVLHVQDHPFSSIDPSFVLKFIKTHFDGGTFLPKTQNYTSIPDGILLFPGTVPILTVRDPRFTVPSTYRVLQSFGLLHGSGRPNFLVSTTPIWIRLMYEFYVSRGITPLVVDADDLMTSTNFIAALARQAGLDPRKLHLSWPEASEEEKAELHPMFYASQKNLIESTGIKAERAAKHVDFEQEMASWTINFGRDDAVLVREMVDSAMPHYHYLYERRFNL
ncbi:putative P-loop containing nucleoside triphosphate hydrolase [Septoria linicola]|nr:putative P-loop containing nucleoside triphosphate hydrolase [Septoria linicola]